MKIAVAQINPTVGDLEGNLEKIMAAYEEAAKAGADLVVAPEMVLTGYPLEDLVLRDSFQEAVNEKIKELFAWVDRSGYAAGLIFGAPQRNDEDKPLNCAFLYDPEEGVGFQSTAKYELPNYGVFDEKRVFVRGDTPMCMEWRGHRIGLMICEDAWFPTVSKTLRGDDAEILISINGSPFEVGKNVTRRQVVAKRVKETGLPFLYVNLVGGQDELVFDGGSFFWDGVTMQEAPHFEEGLYFFDADLPKRQGDDFTPVSLTRYPTIESTGTAAIYQACVLGLRDYMRKQGFKTVVLGYSGGVDSGIVAAMACDAIGAANVHLVRLPSKFSSEGSLTDAAEGALRLGALMRTVSIEPVVDGLRWAYQSGFTGNRELLDHAKWNPGDAYPALSGTADENIQARARGNILMAISNQEGHMLLTTGNKSEVSVGYSTLYGDMSGGFNPIKDCYKITVWALCRWRNSLTGEQIRAYDFKGVSGDVVPEEIIVKPPSAELRPDQKDEDSLPPYPVLDAILNGMIEEELSGKDIAAKLGLEYETVARIRRLVDNAEYKRRQAAPGVKISSKIHGRDRRYPIVNKWRA